MNKDLNIYRTKAAQTIKDMDSERREVAVYLSIFDNIDADNDMIKKGAFKKSIQERGPESTGNRKIAYLRHHDWDWQIGKWLKLEEDDKGLFAVGQLGRSTAGSDAFLDYEDGIIREHSIGFQYIQDKIRYVEDPQMEQGGYFMITEVKLYEGSAVTLGANDLTETVGVMKSEQKKEKADKLQREINTVIKTLANGKGSDERLYSHEMKLKYLNAEMYALATTEPLDLRHSVQNEPPNVAAFDWGKVINSI
jgi:HK97 family phage prohead protease